MSMKLVDGVPTPLSDTDMAQQTIDAAAFATATAAKTAPAAVALQQLQAADAQIFRLIEAMADVLIAKGTVQASDFRADIRALYQARKALRTAAGVP